MNSYPLFVEDFRRFLETQDLCTLFPNGKDKEKEHEETMIVSYGYSS